MMDLTKEQSRAATQLSGNLQLIACAGSGKTEVVALRIANLLAPKARKGGGLKPANIVAFTFTEKAAAELKERVRTRTRDRSPELVGLAEMYIGTIHGFCLDLLKVEAPEFLKYEVLNEVQQSLLVSRNSRESGLSAAETLKGEPLKRYIDAPLYVQALSVLRESHCNPGALRDNSVAAGLDAYRALLHRKRYLDYSAILEEAVRVLRTDPGLRERVAQRVKVVVVDEYQDVNPIQEDLVRTLYDLGAAVTVVGDDDQTLYQWRGSDVHNILSFAGRYPSVKQVRLEDNFRSSVGVTDVARLVIEKNSERLPKTMRAVGQQTYEAGDIVALQLSSPKDEAEYIARTCQALHGTLIDDGEHQRSLSWSDMAVLVRVAASGEPIRQALAAAGIPAVSVGMSSLFEAPEAEAARQLFYMMAGRADVTATEVLKAWVAADLGIPRSVMKAAVSEAESARFKMAREDAEVRFAVYSIQRQFMGFLERIGLREEAVPRGRGEIAFYNLAKFSQAISDFETIHFHSKPTEKYVSFANFLRYQAEHAYSEAVEGVGTSFVAPDAVQILTIHKAKGLQWPVVFVPQLVQNRFPSPRRGGRTVWHLIPAAGVEGQARFLGSAEDERRLFYVAVTRSQKHLHMTTAPTPGSQYYAHPSDFWREVLESKYVKRRPQDYSRRTRGVAQPRPSVASVNLSFSDVKHFFECPYQFKLRTLYGFNGPLAEALGYGKSLHDALAEVHGRAIAGERITQAMTPALVARHLHVPYAYPALRETLQRAAEKVISDYIRSRASEFSQIEFSEKAIEVPLDGGVSLIGRIDLVRRRDTGEVAIVDLKSSQQAQAEELTEAQLHIYALGYRELTGRDADYVEIYELDQQKRNARSVDEDFIEDVKGRILQTAEALRDNRFHPKPSTAVCRRCDFGGMCTSKFVETDHIPRHDIQPSLVRRPRRTS